MKRKYSRIKPKCIDCGNFLNHHVRTVKRCSDCHSKFKIGKNNPFFGKTHSNEIKRKLSIINTGKTVSVETRNKLSISGSNRKHSLETRIKISEANIGEKHPNYIDGRTPLSSMIRHTYNNIKWMMDVRARDNITCKKCKSINILDVHHIKHFAVILSEFLKEYDQFSPIEDKETLVRLATKYKPFWDLENGITLCEDCHKLEHKKRK